ncbi:MAG: outer membrane beta-barrel protein [Opitutaceae bacterium]|nr:outer membrane beta-barrel protein [Opitutaceae bacterium]
MNLTKKITLALAVLAACSAGFAQSSAATGIPVGTLGQRYADFNLGIQDIRHLTDNAYGLGLSANVPVTPHLDLGAGYSYGWLRGAVPAHSNTLTTMATAYTTFNEVRPFAEIGLGYQWVHALGMSDNSGIWAAALGVEIPAGLVSIKPSIVYNDDFRTSSRSAQDVTYGVEVNHWYSKSLAVYAGVGYTDVQNSNLDSWNYSIGLRMRF